MAATGAQWFSGWLEHSKYTSYGRLSIMPPKPTAKKNKKRRLKNKKAKKQKRRKPVDEMIRWADVKPGDILRIGEDGLYDAAVNLCVPGTMNLYCFEVNTNYKPACIYFKFTLLPGSSNLGFCNIGQDFGFYITTLLSNDSKVESLKNNLPVLKQIFNEIEDKARAYAEEIKKILIRLEEALPVGALKGKIYLSKIVLEPAMKKSICDLIYSHSEKNRIKLRDEWGFSKTIEKGLGIAMLFYGPPGTGKTKCAEEIAKELGMVLKMVDPGMIWSSEPGAAERFLKVLFDSAEKNKDGQIICFDECDTLITNRRQSGQILAAQTNTLLSCMERFGGITIFTTNRAPVLDPAVERRLQLKLEFPAPSQELRIMIWQTLMPPQAPLAEDVDFKTLSKSTIAGGHIKNVCVNAARRAIAEDSEKIHMKHFLDSLTDELNGQGAFNQEDDTPYLASGGGLRMGVGR